MRNTFYSTIIALLVISLSGISSTAWASPASNNGMKLVLAASAASSNSNASSKQLLGLNRNPQNPNRQLDWENECVVVLTHDSPEITLASGTEGKTSTGILPAGVAVVINKTTRVAQWVAVCGNDVTAPADWIPEGKYICSPGERYQSACEDTAEILSRLDGIQEGVDKANRKLDLLLRGALVEQREVAEPSVAIKVTQNSSIVDLQRPAKKGEVLVSWEAQNVQSCLLMYPGGVDAVASVTSKTFMVKKDTYFTIQCVSDRHGQIQATQQVPVAKSNPWPWILGAVAVIGAALAIGGGGGGDKGGGGPVTDPDH